MRNQGYDIEHIHSHLMTLPVEERRRHPHTIRLIGLVVVGATITLIGSNMATHTEVLCPLWLPHGVWDAFAYTLHAIGITPVLSGPVEGLWMILTGE